MGLILTKTVGKGKIHAYDNLPSTVDPDAQAFITAANITDPTQQTAIIQLVTDLKNYNLWTKAPAIYPFVGGTEIGRAHV